MPSWLTAMFEDAAATPPAITFEKLIVLPMLAFVLGCVVALIYRLTKSSSTVPTPSFASSLVLLTILIALVTLVIGESIARAFGLIGALSIVRIVRFRTEIEDTRDTVFVVFAVVVGMAVGSGIWPLALMSLAVTGLAAALIRPRQSQNAEPWALNVRVAAGATPEAPLQEIFRKHLADVRLVATSTTRQGSALDLTYHIHLRPASTATVFATELNLQAGLQTVELKRL